MSIYSELLEDFARKETHFIELIYTPHVSWPLLPESSLRDLNDGRYLSVSVLDSSFNPPTLAHAALAQLTVPVTGSDSSSSPRGDYDACMLLFSMKNADKQLKPGDATPSQRLEMMVILAQELQDIGRRTGNRTLRNVAVALCREPTFVGKSTALNAFFRQRMHELSSPMHVQLTFLMGFDTLERLFAPRYYGSESAMKHALLGFLSSTGDNSRVLCARRNQGASYTQSETDVLDVAAEFIGSGEVALTDIHEANRTLSSSEIRESIRNGSTEWEIKTLPGIATYVKEHSLYIGG
ncbi:Nucleotidylyl transferase [Hysterangium stoloniferum]|nr:Nucleotidylyl transferase [Hysterangium stoloniferum]